MAKRLDQITNEFERGVHWALYRSREQRLRRSLAIILLLLKHGVRGLVYIWPFYIVVAAVMISPTLKENVPYMVALLPGVLAWFYIYLAGARKDYQRLVRGMILRKGFIKRLILG